MGDEAGSWGGGMMMWGGGEGPRGAGVVRDGGTGSWGGGMILWDGEAG